MDLLDLEIEEGRVPSNFRDRSRELGVVPLTLHVPFCNSFDEYMQLIFRTKDSFYRAESSLNFKKGLELLEKYTGLNDDPDLKELITSYDDDRYIFSGEFGRFTEYVFSKKGVRAITASKWKEGIAFSFFKGDDCIRLHLPTQNNDLGKIYLTGDMIHKLNLLVKRASDLTFGDTCILFNYDMLYRERYSNKYNI